MESVQRTPQSVESVEKGLGLVHCVAYGRPDGHGQGTGHDGEGVEEQECLIPEYRSQEDGKEEQYLDSAPFLGRPPGPGSSLSGREPL